MKALEYIDAIKAKHNVSSDYAVAKLLGVPTSKMSEWRSGRTLPGTLYCFRIAELLGDQPAAVIADIELERSEKGERDAEADAWREVLGKIGGGLGALALAVGLSASPSRVDAGTLSAVDDGGSVYYVKSLAQLVARAIVALVGRSLRWKLVKKPASSWLDALTPGAVVSPA